MRGLGNTISVNPTEARNHGEVGGRGEGRGGTRRPVSLQAPPPPHTHNFHSLGSSSERFRHLPLVSWAGDRALSMGPWAGTADSAEAEVACRVVPDSRNAHACAASFSPTAQGTRSNGQWFSCSTVSSFTVPVPPFPCVREPFHVPIASFQLNPFSCFPEAH